MDILESNTVHLNARNTHDGNMFHKYINIPIFLDFNTNSIAYTLISAFIWASLLNTGHLYRCLYGYLYQTPASGRKFDRIPPISPYLLYPAYSACAPISPYISVFSWYFWVGGGQRNNVRFCVRFLQNLCQSTTFIEKSMILCYFCIFWHIFWCLLTYFSIYFSIYLFGIGVS